MRRLQDDHQGFQLQRLAGMLGLFTEMVTDRSFGTLVRLAYVSLLEFFTLIHTELLFYGLSISDSYYLLEDME